MSQNQNQNQNQNEQKIERAEQVLKTKIKTHVRAGGRGAESSNKEWME